MLNDDFVLVYQQLNPLWLMDMSKYNCHNVQLTKVGQEIRVSENEKRFLLKIKNGVEPIFKLKQEDVWQ